MAAIDTISPTLDFTSYARGAFVDSLEFMANDIANAFAGVEFDTLVGTGTSGGAVVPELARRLGKNWILVRKPAELENSHGESLLVGILGQRWIFVDDFVSTGETLRRVRSAINGEVEARSYNVGFSTKMVGTYQYNKDVAYIV